MFRYFLFYKPYQVLSQFSAEGNKKTLADYFVGIPKDVYPVGRLDYDSEGLLLLTNDKKLTQQLLEPRHKHQRTYYVQVEGKPEQVQLHQLERGVLITIEGKPYHTLPARASEIAAPELPARNPPIRFRKSIPDTWIALTLVEGKNRQVRRMTAAIGFPTLRLVRYSIGQISLDDLQPGGYRELTTKELPLLMRNNT